MTEVFQWYIYLISIAIVLILNLTGAVRAVIVWACDLGPGSDQLDAVGEAQPEQSAKKLPKTPQQIKLEESSRVIGCLEKFLYCYFIIRGQESALGCLLLFKGFTHWLHQQEQVSAAGAAEGHAPLSKALLRYYSYAVGNFISLLFAILICEVVTSVVRGVPWLKQHLWLG
ncbi:hypothetical protein [Sediminicoccus sp. BL-A-41-H5]|uniref:hypothetical protein n=1 Tax=Sediminicoccus sp. BL-A-41-H5 TaxID=3421106 RepID=UPI003D6645B7